MQDSSTAGSEGRRAFGSPEPWGPDELVSFASSLAWQVAKKLSKHDDLVQGVFDRFAEDLHGLSRGPGGPSHTAMAGAWQQEPEDLLWWPMWWCPYPPQWSAAGAEEMPLTADEPAACRPAEVGAQSPVALEHVVQTCRAKPTRRGSKKRRGRRRRVVSSHRSLSQTVSCRNAQGHPACKGEVTAPATTCLAPLKGVSVQPRRPGAVWRRRGCVALAFNQNLVPSQHGARRPAAEKKETHTARSSGTFVSVLTLC